MSIARPDWDNSKCACVHWDARECAEARDRHMVGREDFEGDHRHEWPSRECECCCHEGVEPDDDDL